MGQRTQPAPTYVLVIEDQPLLMMSMVDYVELAGCEAIEAYAIDDALEILASRADIRIVFTDLDMRGSIMGMALAAAIRDRWPPIELVLTSSQVDPALDRIPARGVHFGKPFDRKKIVAAIRRFAA